MDINENDNVGYLKRKIGERMEETHEDFNGLRGCRATQIYQADKEHNNTQNRGKDKEERHTHKLLNENMLIKQCLKSGDKVFFEIDTQDVWLHTSLSLFLHKKPIFIGEAELKVAKEDTLGSLKKKLQVFAIKLWCIKNKQQSSEDDLVSETSASAIETPQKTSIENYRIDLQIIGDEKVSLLKALSSQSNHSPK